MIELHLIGYTADLGHLVLDLEASGGGRYRLVVDGDLYATLDDLREHRWAEGMEVGLWEPDEWVEVDEVGELRLADDTDDTDDAEDLFVDVDREDHEDVDDPATVESEEDDLLDDVVVLDDVREEPVTREPPEPDGVGADEVGADEVGADEVGPDEEVAGSDREVAAPDEPTQDAAGPAASRPDDRGGEWAGHPRVRVLASPPPESVEDESDSAAARDDADPADESGPAPASPAPDVSPRPVETTPDAGRDSLRRDDLVARAPRRQPRVEDDEPLDGALDALISRVASSDDGDAPEEDDAAAAADAGAEHAAQASQPDVPARVVDAPPPVRTPRPAAAVNGAATPTRARTSRPAGTPPAGPQRPRTAGGVPVPDEAKLGPKQIQGLLRSGKSVRQVAKAAGTDVRWVERWLEPILAEQERVISDARKLGITVGGKTCKAPLADAVDHHLRRLGADPERVAWSATRRDDGPWRVSVRYVEDGRSRKASWTVDRTAGKISPASSAARELGWLEPSSSRR